MAEFSIVLIEVLIYLEGGGRGGPYHGFTEEFCAIHGFTEEFFAIHGFDLCVSIHCFLTARIIYALFNLRFRLNFDAVQSKYSTRWLRSRFSTWGI